MTTPIKGKTYEVDHARKGKFMMRVDFLDDEFAAGEVVAGVATGLNRHWRVGDKISVRLSFSTFTEVESPEGDGEAVLV